MILIFVMTMVGRNLPQAKATIQIIPIAVLALLVVDLNFRGKQMAYHRSIDMKVRVRIDTVTDTL